MGIAHRKAGTVVSSPTCHGWVKVPTPPGQEEEEQHPASAKVPKPNVFEKPDFDADIVQPRAFHTHGAEPPPTAPQAAEFDVEPIVLSSAIPEATVMPMTSAVPRSVWVLLVIGAVLLAAIAFAAGFAVAKLFAPG
jgi:hypothetical protein